MTDLTHEPALLPCPFCGGEAGSCPDPNHSTGWDVGCFSGTCSVEPHVWAVHRETADMQWNTRAATQPQAIRAKPLVWDQSGGSHVMDGESHTVPSGYIVRYADENGWKWRASGIGAYGWEPSPALAKAAAQAHHDARIMAAIEPAPCPRDAVIAQLVDALSRVKHSIEIGGGCGVTDVVWLDDLVPETVCDFIESTIAAAKVLMP